MIGWNEPTFGKKEAELVAEVLRSGYVSEGPKTKELESKLAKIIGCKYIIMTTSCTAALYLAIEADKRIKHYTKGLVIIPDLTFVATKNAVEMAGLTPLALDVDADIFVFKSGCKIKVAKICVCVNLLGRTSYWNQNNETIIYDNAGCLGSDVPIGKVGCYSLQGNKIISCGQGGFCATDDNNYAREIRKIKDFGRENKSENNNIGFNFKFNDILAAVCLGQLEQLEARKKLLKKQYLIYKKNLSKFGKFIDFKKDEIPLWVEFIVKKRDVLFDYLKENKISCRKPWEPITRLPNAKFYSNNVMWLPNGAGLSEDSQNKVINTIKEFYNGRV